MLLIKCSSNCLDASLLSDLEAILFGKMNALEKLSLCLLHRAPQSVSRSLLAPQLSLFVYLIYGQIQKGTGGADCCHYFILLALHSEKWRKSRLWSTKLSLCVTVLCGSATFQGNFTPKRLPAERLNQCEDDMRTYRRKGAKTDRHT